MTTAACLAVVLLLVALLARRHLDHRADRAEWARILARAETDPPRFTKGMVADLPDAARRYFDGAIREGTPLQTCARLTMEGQFGLGDRGAPNYLPMRAHQVLDLTQGFVWKMAGGRGLMRISGSDSAGWTRFWLAGFIPVARAGGTADHARSAFARLASEALFWTPAALLRRPDARWEAMDDTGFRVTLTQDGHRHALEVTLDDTGRPLRITLQRWSNANPEKTYRLQPFGGSLSKFREVEGFCIPTHVEAGNFFGTDAYFPFFIADVTEIRFGP